MSCHTYAKDCCGVTAAGADGFRKGSGATPCAAKPLILLDSVFNAGGKLANIDLNKKSMIENKCSELVNIFQRSSSCVEGRNGVISFKHHQLHDMSERKRGVMTAIHNFFNLRKDKKTAAERFFENKPADLFQKVLDSISIPARPLSPPRKIFGGNVAAAF